ncbi:MAG: hypothetical protein BVN35_07590 [Proteobacteria bacterium ST_bin11]|nr:MAG: hypothetical protein BVN35_07590 [Proteobacteria bacterium ST_bin11]
MCPVIEISDELFTKLQSHAIGFGDTPAAVIERLLNIVESTTRNDLSNVEESTSVDDSVISEKLKVNPKQFLKENFPDLLKYKRSASRMWESKEKRNYLDNWWFNFKYDYLETNEFIVFVGALDYTNKDFRVFKVSTEYLLQNIEKIDKSKDGMINLYVHMKDLIDLRNKHNLSFRDFALNL